MDKEKLSADLKFEEGRRVCAGLHYVYRDSLSYQTIGYGRLLQQGLGGLTEDEACYLLNNDIERTSQRCALLKCWPLLNEVRQRAIVMMAFQLGITKLLKFKNMFAALEASRWEDAGTAALESKWAKEDSPDRAARIAYMLKTGTDPIKK